MSPGDSAATRPVPVPVPDSDSDSAGRRAGIPYRLVATDLDGTLLGTDRAVSQRSRDTLAAAAAAGAAHIVVTGRSVSRVREVLDDLSYRGLAVCGQGGQLYHAGKHRLLTSVTLDRGLAARALAAIEAETGALYLAAGRGELDGGMLVGPGFRGYRDGFLPVASFADRADLWAAPLSGICIQHPDLNDDDLARVARRAAGKLVGVTVSGPGLVELLPLGLTKATGLGLAARRLGVTAADTIAFGDMPNDIPMLGWAAHGVAMGNAHDELKAVSDEVTTSNDEDGIAVVLERLLSSC